MGPHLNTAMPAGTITALTVQQHEPTRVSVFLDGTFAFGVSQELVRQWDLWVGRQLSVEDQAHLSAAEQLLTAQATARQYLVARPRTAHEVRQKLRRSGVPDQRVDQVITRLQNRGVLDDTAYAHAYLTSRLASRGYGPQRLRQELQQRGRRPRDAGHAWLVKPIVPNAGRSSGRSCARDVFPLPWCSKSSRRWQRREPPEEQASFPCACALSGSAKGTL